MKTNKEELNIRLPRPTGTTLLIKQGRTKEAQEQVLTQWVTNNFTLCQITYSIPDIARMLNLSPAMIVKQITKPMKSWLLQGKQEDNYHALLSFCLNFLLSDRYQTQNQLSLLIADQQGHYKPFLSTVVSHGITNLLQSTKSFVDFAKLFKPEVAKNPALDQGLANPSGSTQGTKYLGTVEAVKLIEANRDQNILDGGTLQSQILSKEKLEDLPEVVATKQQGLDSTGMEKKVKKRIHNTAGDPNIKDAIIIP